MSFTDLSLNCIKLKFYPQERPISILFKINIATPQPHPLPKGSGGKAYSVDNKLNGVDICLNLTLETLYHVVNRIEKGKTSFFARGARAYLILM